MQNNRDFQSRGSFAPRQMVQGNWICGQDAKEGDFKGCGKEITEMPFEPTPGRAIYCRDCFKKMREERGFSRPNRY